MDDLGLGVEVDAVGTSFAAHAGCLHAAEGGAQVTDVVGVDPDHAGFDGVRDAVAALEVRGPDVRGQAEPGGVRQLDRLRLVVEGCDRHDGAEDLLLEDPGVPRHIGEDGRLEVVALGEVVGAGTTRHQPGFLLADLDVVQDTFVVLTVDQRADLGVRVRRESDRDLLGALGEAAGELLVERPLDEDA